MNVEHRIICFIIRNNGALKCTLLISYIVILKGFQFQTLVIAILMILRKSLDHQQKKYEQIHNITSQYTNYMISFIHVTNNPTPIYLLGKKET